MVKCDSALSGTKPVVFEGGKQDGPAAEGFEGLGENGLQSVSDLATLSTPTLFCKGESTATTGGKVKGRCFESV